LNEFENTQIRELPFAEFERNISTGVCFMTGTPDLWNEDHYQALGSVLARHAGRVDDELEDSVFWFKASNTGAGEAATKVAEAIANAALSGVKALVAALYCFGKLFVGELCDGDYAWNLVPDLDLNRLQGALPGVHSHSKSSYVGFWHMMQLDDVEGEYNDVPGTNLEFAGPGGNPGVADLAIMIAADLTGLSIHARDSKGVSRYGSYDEVERSVGEWQSFSIGHTEFSPLNNLAEYGWRHFRADGTRSIFLGWPLHAFGDTIVPHHLVGTTSYGHLGFEDAMAAKWSEIFQGNDDEIVEEAFQLWRRYCYAQDMEYISPMVLEVAAENRSMINEMPFWPFNDLVTSKEQKKEMYLLDSAFFVSEMRPLVINASAGALATLICAASADNETGDYRYVQVEDPDPDTRCPEGFGYCPTHSCGFQCVEGYTWEPSLWETHAIGTMSDWAVMDTDVDTDTQIIIE